MTKNLMMMIAVGIIMGLIAYFVPNEIGLMVDIFFLIFALFCFIAENA